MQGGIGFSSHDFDDGTTICALVAVNALGSVINPQDGKIIAGPKRDGKIFDSVDLLINGKPEKRGFQNTTIGTIITNAKINDLDAGKINAGTISSARIDVDTLNVKHFDNVSADIVNQTSGTVPLAVYNSANQYGGSYPGDQINTTETTLEAALLFGFANSPKFPSIF